MESNPMSSPLPGQDCPVDDSPRARAHRRELPQWATPETAPVEHSPAPDATDDPARPLPSPSYVEPSGGFTTADDEEDRLRALLGLRPRAWRPTTAYRVMGWLGPLIIAVTFFIVGLSHIGTPERLMFDETYYVKDAYTLSQLGYEADWEGDDADARFIVGDYSTMVEKADYVVHPPFGKWLISVGITIFGPQNPIGWRFSSLVFGSLMILLLGRIALRMFRSPLLATTASVLLAVDGQTITAAGIGILDVFLAFFILAGFWALLRDRQWTRARLAHLVAHAPPERPNYSPRVGIRWWLVATGILTGLACGVKWSGIYAVAVFGIAAYVWDASARRRLGVRHWLVSSVIKGGIPAFFALVPTAFLAYLSAWTSWFISDKSWGRHLVAEYREKGRDVIDTFLPDALDSWWMYHLKMWKFHNHLTSKHSYQAKPWEWIVQGRPTVFYWPSSEEKAAFGDCGGNDCVATVISLGNPIIWWGAIAALLALVYAAYKLRDWRAWAIIAGYAAGYFPWFGYSHRTIFQFYSIAFTGFVVLALTFALAWVCGILERPDDSLWRIANTRGWTSRFGYAAHPPLQIMAQLKENRAHDDDAAPPARTWRSAIGDLCAQAVSHTGAVRARRRQWLIFALALAVILAATIFFWPVWTAKVMPYDQWHLRMWFNSWI